MFERFTELAIKTIMFAQEETTRLGHKFVGTEQILIGLMLTNGSAATCLESMGVKLDRVRDEVEAIIGRGKEPPQQEFPFSPRAKKVLESAWDEARRLEDRDITSGHLLLGLIRENEGVAARVLEKMGIDIASIRSKMEELMKSADAESGRLPSVDGDAIHTSLGDLMASVRKAKEMAIRGQEFELAAWLRAQESVLSTKIRERLHKD